MIFFDITLRVSNNFSIFNLRLLDHGPEVGQWSTKIGLDHIPKSDALINFACAVTTAFYIRV
jgi:hypothetical protein